MEMTITLPDDILTSDRYEDPEELKKLLRETVNDLMEELEDIRAYDAAKAELENGEDSFVTLEEAVKLWNTKSS